MHHNGANSNPTRRYAMFTKTLIALAALFALFASFDFGANAQPNCGDEGHISAYARPGC